MSIDYDHFVRDYQQQEKRENFYLLKESSLLKSWPRSKVEKISNYAFRRTYFDIGAYVYRQGDVPEYVYFILEGKVNIVKEVKIYAKNRYVL